MDNNNKILLPTGCWIKTEDIGNGMCGVNMSQFSSDILENKDNWTPFKPPFIKNGRIIQNNYADLKSSIDTLKNDTNK